LASLPFILDANHPAGRRPRSHRRGDEAGVTLGTADLMAADLS
jgi:hypothetical protein